jgi:hypothetical protein
MSKEDEKINEEILAEQMDDMIVKLNEIANKFEHPNTAKLHAIIELLTADEDINFYTVLGILEGCKVDFVEWWNQPDPNNCEDYEPNDKIGDNS